MSKKFCILLTYFTFILYYFTDVIVFANLIYFYELTTYVGARGKLC